MFLRLYNRDLENIQECSIYISGLIRQEVEVLQKPNSVSTEKGTIVSLFKHLSFTVSLLQRREWEES